MTSRIRLRTTQVEKFMRMKSIDNQTQLAARIHVDASTVYRVLEGRNAPGEKFIAGILAAFPELEFSDLFEVVETTAA